MRQVEWVVRGPITINQRVNSSRSSDDRASAITASPSWLKAANSSSVSWKACFQKARTLLIHG